MPKYCNDFPDWDRQDWAVLVAPSIPSFLVVCVSLFGFVLLYAVLFKLRNRRSNYTFLGDKPSGSWH